MLYANDHDIPWVSTDDIGNEAAKYLLDARWAGKWTCNLMGSENLTLLEITAVFSQLLDCPIEQVQVAIESLQQRLALMGATITVQKQLGDLFLALGDHNVIYVSVRTLEAITPTTFEHFTKNNLLPKKC